MLAVLYIGIGSFVGGAARYCLSNLVVRFLPEVRFPFATLTVNVLGCLAIGVLAALAERGMLSQNLRLFLVTGLLGGFTTFSAFGLESFLLLSMDNFSLAVTNIISSVFLCIVAVWIGMKGVQLLCST